MNTGIFTSSIKFSQWVTKKPFSSEISEISAEKKNLHLAHLIKLK
jgi:hypothetical protein